MPLKRFVLLHVIKRTSRTFPTLEKNSCRSRGRIRCDNCMQNTVRASKSSSLTSSAGVRLSPRPFGGVLPRRNDRGDGVRRRLFGERLRLRCAGGGERLRGERLRSRRRSFDRTFLSRAGLVRRSLSRDLVLCVENVDVSLFMATKMVVITLNVVVFPSSDCVETPFYVNLLSLYPCHDVSLVLYHENAFPRDAHLFRVYCL